MTAATVLYVAGAVVCFGDAAHRADVRAHAEYAGCLASERPFCFDNADDAFMYGLIAAVTWPLYLSWRYQEGEWR